MSQQPPVSDSRDNRVLAFVNEVSTFSSLPEAARVELSKYSSFERVDKKSILFEEGDAPDGAYMVATGWVFLRKKTHKGKSVVAELIGPGDAFGLVTASRGKPYPLGAEALRESVVLHVDQNALIQLTSEYPGFSDQMLKICSERLQDSYSLVSRLADADSKSRVAIALRIAASKFSRQIGFDENCLDLTRQELSDIAGTTVETAIRVTRNLEKEGILSFPGSKKIQILDSEKLQSCCQAQSLSIL